MRIIARVAIAGAMLASFLVVGGPAQASIPAPLTISVHRDGGDTWIAVGAFADSGSFVDNPGFFAGQSSTFHVVRTFTGVAGTFSARGDVRISPTDDPNVLAVTGRWAVLRGTGAYENLHGVGTIAESFDTFTGTIQGTWQGKVHFD